MEKCSKCGNKLSNIDVLCPKCGALVEVVQVRKGAGMQIASSAISVPIKKLPQQNLILYNDDWPSDDMEGLLLPDETPPINTENIETSVAPEKPELPARENKTMQMLTEAAMYTDEADVAFEESSLNLLRNMRLPELEHISPYEAAVKSEYTPDASPSGPEINPPETRAARHAPQHSWLEIEEVEPVRAADAPDPQGIASDAPAVTDAAEDAPVLTPEATASDTAITPDDAVTPAAAPVEAGYRRRYRENHTEAQPIAPRPRKAAKALLMAFVWLVIAGLLFCGFYFLDQFVTNHYDGYSQMIFQMSGGQINPDTSADTPPVSQDAPVS